MIDAIILWGGVAGAITAILILIGMIFSKIKKIFKIFNQMKEHTEENYLNNLRLVIMSDEMPIEERLRAGEKYITAGGNGQVKAFYKKLQNEYMQREDV